MRAPSLQHKVIERPALCPHTASRLPACVLQEVRSLLRARKMGVPTPVPYHVDLATACIYMERVGGESVKALLRQAELGAEGEAGGSRVRGGGV